jgi:hypothetical protein
MTIDEIVTGIGFCVLVRLVVFLAAIAWTDAIKTVARLP